MKSGRHSLVLDGLFFLKTGKLSETKILTGTVGGILEILILCKIYF